MTRYFTGINSVSFLEAFNQHKETLDKRLIEGVQNPEKIWLVADPFLLNLNSKTTLLRHKSSARQAVELSGKHGGFPLVIECGLKPYSLCQIEGHPCWFIYEGPEVRIRNIYRVKKQYSLGKTDLAFALARTTPEQVRALHL